RPPGRGRGRLLPLALWPHLPLLRDQGRCRGPGGQRVPALVHERPQDPDLAHAGPGHHPGPGPAAGAPGRQRPAGGGVTVNELGSIAPSVPDQAAVAEATRELAAFVARLTYDDLPEAVRERARWVFADTVGVALRGSVEPEMQALYPRLR